MGFVKNIKEKKLVWITLIILCTVFVFLLIYNKNSYANVYYRTYTKENGWTKWSKNAEINGNKNTISAIEVKMKSNLDGKVVYKSYYNKKWEEKNRTDKQLSGNKKDEINSIRMKLTGDLNERYNIKYRIKCTDKEWSAWEDYYGEVFYSEGTNYDLPIKKVQIKLEEK